MKKLLRRIGNLLAMGGVDLLKPTYSLKGLPYFIRDLKTLKCQMKSSTCEFPLGKTYPCLSDRFAESGSAKGHYFHQDLLVARRIYLNNPIIHVDVGSRIDGFVAHLASFRLVKVIDIRPLYDIKPNIKFVQVDFMSPIPDALVQYCDSLSCLHAMEHFGLGRYGDPVNYNGYLLGLNNIYQVLKKGGKLYFSVPIGPQRIEFNAHRVFSVSYLINYFMGKYTIDQFSFVDDAGELHENIPITEAGAQNNFGCVFGCGIFEMTKL